MNHTDAEQVTVSEPTSAEFQEGWLVQRRYDVFLAPSKDSADHTIHSWTANGHRCRLFRLPSESEAALAPFVDAYHRAAVELAEAWIHNRDTVEVAGTPLFDLEETFAAAKSALAAFTLEEKQ